MSRESRKIGRIAAAITVLTLALTTIGCQSIPSAGPLHTGLQTLDQTNARVEFSVSGPVAGAKQEDIVRGFVAAAASHTNDYAVARQFLSADYSQDWDPYFGVLVDQGTHNFELDSEGVALLSVDAVASIDGEGTFVPLQPVASTALRFEMVQENGEWRIASSPAGIVVDKSTFTAAWTPQLLYFLSFGDRLVAETRWYLDRSALSTQVVNGLLAGPSAFTSEVADSAFPWGTQLVSGSVPVTDGVAQIELSEEVLNVDTVAMDSIKRQIGATLLDIPEVTRFELLVNGTVVDSGSVIAADTTVPTSQNQYVAVLRGEVFGPAGGAVGVQTPDIGKAIADLQPAAVALAPNRRGAAVLNENGVTLVTATENKLVDARSDLLHPGLDTSGTVWSYSSADPQFVQVTRPNEAPELLQLPYLAGATPAGIRVSQGGSFLAVLVPDETRENSSRVMLAGVVRNAQGLPLRIGDIWATVAWIEGGPIDLDWLDEQTLMVLSDSRNNVEATQVTLGQFSVTSGTVAEAVQVSGGGTRSLFRVLDSRGRLYAPQGSGWQRMQSDIDVVAKIG